MEQMMIGSKSGGLFNAASPIEMGAGNEPEYNSKMPLFKLRKKLLTLGRRVGDVLRVREQLDKLYSNGYFQNHYPKADSSLKELMHQRAVSSISQMMNEEEEEEKEIKPEASKGASIIINIGV